MFKGRENVLREGECAEEIKGGELAKLTIDNEQLTIRVSLRDDSNQLVRKPGKYPENLRFHNTIFSSPEGIPQLSIINCQLSIHTPKLCIYPFAMAARRSTVT